MNLEMLQRQHQEYEALRHTLARTEWQDSELMHDCTALPRHDHEGRGGAAVWRGERKLTMERIAAWVVNGRFTMPFEATNPGWSLVQPAGWTAESLAFGQLPSRSQQRELADRRVLLVRAGSRSAIWPYDTQGRLIARFDLVLAATSRKPPASVVELVLLRTDDIGEPWVPSELACAWGLMTPEERDRLEAQAEGNRRRAARAAADHWHHSDWLPEALESVVDDPRRFARLARQQGVRGGPFRAGCWWRVPSVADALHSGATDEQVTWLVGAIDSIRTRRLERAMEWASQEAYWHGKPHPDDIV